MKCDSGENTILLAVPEKVGGKLFRNAWACSKTQKCVLDGAWIWIFVLIKSAPPDELNSLALIQEHIAISNSELRELLICHRHREHIINVDSTIKDVFCSKIRALWSRGIYSQCFSRDDLTFLSNRRDFPLLRNNPHLGLFVARF